MIQAGLPALCGVHGPPCHRGTHVHPGVQELYRGAYIPAPPCPERHKCHLPLKNPIKTPVPSTEASGWWVIRCRTHKPGGSFAPCPAATYAPGRPPEPRSQLPRKAQPLYSEAATPYQERLSGGHGETRTGGCHHRGGSTSQALASGHCQATECLREPRPRSPHQKSEYEEAWRVGAESTCRPQAPALAARKIYRGDGQETKNSCANFTEPHYGECSPRSLLLSVLGTAFHRHRARCPAWLARLSCSGLG